MVGRGFSVLALVLFLGTACDDPTAVRPKIPETPPVQPPVGMHPEGVYEFTVTGLGTDDIRATATRVDVSSGKISPAAEIRAGLTQVVGLTFESSSSGSFMEGARGQDGYRYVTIDLQGYRTGSLNEGLLLRPA